MGTASWIVGVVVGLLFLLEGEAYAWGPCVHTMLSMGILSSAIGPIPEGIMLLISAFPFEFIYGGLSLDFQMKSGNSNHMHVWEDGFKALKKADTRREKAYAVGFLTHLAADIGAHHFFIPKVLKETDNPKGMKHLLWEIRVDRWFARAYSHLAEYTIKLGHGQCDHALKGHDPLMAGLYDVKKGVYKKALFLNRLVPRLRLLQDLSPKVQYIKTLAQNGLYVSKEAVLSILREREGSWAVSLDPMGQGGQ